MAQSRVNLRIDIQSDSVDAAAKAQYRLARSSKNVADETKSFELGAEQLNDVLTGVLDQLGGLTPAGNQAASALSKIPLKGVGLAAGAAVAGVVALGAAVYQLAQTVRDAAGDLNDRMMQALAEAKEGSAEFGQELQVVERTMKVLRAETRLQQLGFTDLETATEDVTEAYIRNEAVARTLDAGILSLSDSAKQLAVDAFASMYRATVDNAAATIRLRVAAEEARSAMEQMYATFTSGEGAQRLAGLGQRAEKTGLAFSTSFEHVVDSLFAMEEAEITAAIAGGRMNTQFIQNARALEEQGRITGQAVDDLLRWTSTTEGSEIVALSFSAALEQLRIDQDLLSDSTREGAEAQSESAAATDDHADSLRDLIGIAHQFRDAYVDAMDAATDAQARIQQKIKDGARIQQEALAAEADIIAQKEQLNAAAAKDAQQTATESSGSMSAIGNAAVNAVQSTITGLSSAIGQGLGGEGEKAGKVVKRILGDILVSLGTAAIAQGTIAIVGSLIPALGATWGTPANGAALIAAGAAALATGAALGASAAPATGGGKDPVAADPNTGGAGGGITNVYNVQLGAGLSRRAQQRSSIELVESAVGAGA